MNNYHTHTTRCHHAHGKDREYIKTAIKYNIKELGFSDHSPVIFPEGYYSNFRMEIDKTKDYVNSIKLLRREYKDEIKIYLGFELEYYPKLFEKTEEFLKNFDYDFLILGQHFTDNEYEKEAHYCGSPSDDIKLFDKYINQALAGLETGKFAYIAHPDLFKWTGSNEIYIEKMTYFCKKIKELGYPCEFNLLGFAEKRNYPDKRFWKIVGEVGNDVIIGFDAHTPSSFKQKKLLEESYEFLKEFGITPIEKLNL